MIERIGGPDTTLVERTPITVPVGEPVTNPVFGDSVIEAIDCGRDEEVLPCGPNRPVAHAAAGIKATAAIHIKIRSVTLCIFVNPFCALRN